MSPSQCKLSTSMVFIGLVAFSLVIPGLADAEKPCGGALGRPHVNGGGFVASTAFVSPNVELDSKSSVCDSFKIIKSGPIRNSNIGGNGAMVNTGVIKDSVISGYVLIAGDVECDGAKIGGPDLLMDKDSKAEWVRVGGKSTVRGSVLGIKVVITGSTIEKNAIVQGKEIEILRTTIRTAIVDCTSIKDGQRGTCTAPPTEKPQTVDGLGESELEPDTFAPAGGKSQIKR